MHANFGVTPGLVALIQSAFRHDVGVRDLKDVADGSQRKRAERVQEMFSQGLQLLRESVPNARLKTLGGVAWDIFHYRYTCIVYGVPVETLSFAVNNTGEALVFVPEDWAFAAMSDPVMQFGALVFISSQVADWYNKRFEIEEPKMFLQRARAYEAEYLRHLGRVKLNAYQQSVLAAFPHGFDPALGYTYRPVAPTQ